VRSVWLSAQISQPAEQRRSAMHILTVPVAIFVI